MVWIENFDLFSNLCSKVTRTKFRSLIKLLESKSTTVKNKQSYSRTTIYNKYFLFVIVAFFHSKINAILKNICFEDQTYEQDASSYVCTQRIQKKTKPKWQVNLSILQIDLIMFQIIILIILQVDIKKVAYQQILFFLHDDDKKGQCRRDKLTC